MASCFLNAMKPKEATREGTSRPFDLTLHVQAEKLTSRKSGDLLKDLI